MRQHPTRVRAAFLVGVVTPDFRLPLPFARASQNAFDLMLVDCAADRVCHDAFPRLKHEFGAVLARFDRGPIVVKMLDAATQQTRSVRLERENYVEHLRAMLYSTAGARWVPFVVHRAFEGDFLPFQTMATRFNLGGPGAARGMYFSATCAESIPFRNVGTDRVGKSRSTSPLGHSWHAAMWARNRLSPRNVPRVSVTISCSVSRSPT